MLADQCLTPDSNRTRVTHSWRFRQISANTIYMYYMSSFFPRTVTTRNSLPSAIADAHVLVSFKHGLSNLTTLVLLTFLSFSFHSKPSTITRCIEVECDCANVSCRSREANLRRRKNLSTATILIATLNRLGRNKTRDQRPGPGTKIRDQILSAENGY